jgi:UDP-2,3-diacylglucosamine pyrophosphatase LpxH
MIVLLSDLHLTDTVERSTINTSSLLQWLTDLAQRSRVNGIDNLTLVLLGDIFELLKSRTWIEREVRPWQPPLQVHVESVLSIFESIVASNNLFFAGLRQLIKDYPFVHLKYVPGNHDWPLNTDMGRAARVRLREELPLGEIGDAKFFDVFNEPGHGVIAKHGHERDPSNRYRNGQSAIGDAIVIDLLVRLPMLVGDKLGLHENDPRLDFLHELDNIRPQSFKLTAQWILDGITRLSESHHDARAKIQAVVRQLAKELPELEYQARFETFEAATLWIDFLLWVLNVFISKADFLGAARLLPSGSDSPGKYYEFAMEDMLIACNSGVGYRYVVYGHTHMPEAVAMDLGSTHQGERTRLYLNTGMWRRVRRAPKVSSGDDQLPAFTCWEEQCAVIIYHPAEQKSAGLPAYEFHRVTCGRHS